MNIRVWIAIGVALLIAYTVVVAIIVGPKEEDAPTNQSLGDSPSVRDLKP